MVDQGEEERPERASRGVERLGRSPQGQEGILDDLLGDQVLRGDAQRHPVGRAGVPAVELVEGRSFASGDQPVELEIVPVVLSHGLFLPHGDHRSLASMRRCPRS